MNAVVLVLSGICFLVSATNDQHYTPHLGWSAFSAAITILIVGLTITSLVDRERYKQTLIIVTALQIVRLYPTLKAVRTWPAGDDVTPIAYEGLILPLMVLLAIAGLAAVLSYLVINFANFKKT